LLLQHDTDSTNDAALLTELAVKPRLALFVGALVQTKRLALLLPSAPQGCTLPFCFKVDWV
jgi:hypothetical protein